MQSGNRYDKKREVTIMLVLQASEEQEQIFQKLIQTMGEHQKSDDQSGGCSI